MKIVRCSNFDDESYNEKFVAENIPDDARIATRKIADIMCQALVMATDVQGMHYYRVVPDDYVLHKFEP